ncbi:hypothetical protein [Butyrivibrio sp. INlla18]|uniref:hypothetical protein n=1 Tax=Butyrivibrio sp. INlla18 TaxID=1520806 RepID=UPI000B87E5AF|nr:hypothetical protein [Butyrivibrio sp. INlla18]
MSSLKSKAIPELVDRQNTIIKEQADIIDSLFLLLLQYVPAEELDKSKEVEQINHIALLKEEINV